MYFANNNVLFCIDNLTAMYEICYEKYNSNHFCTLKCHIVRQQCVALQTIEVPTSSCRYNHKSSQLRNLSLKKKLQPHFFDNHKRQFYLSRIFSTEYSSSPSPSVSLSTFLSFFPMTPSICI